ncbi:hypothetical protein T01_15640 [Trichinella spiralis]|uniref:Uncharacterized protein n=1 Tax=Trichinella spiralis TaxID=6334 RepID=A0A0V1BJK5_TRISP|nr:hypothetical protein T01_15640 [Trichinella spiralis]
MKQIWRSYQLRWALVEGGLMVFSNRPNYVRTVEQRWFLYIPGQPINFVHNSYGLRHPMNSVLVPSLVSSRETTVPVRFDLTERVGKNCLWQQYALKQSNSDSGYQCGAAYLRISICNRYDISVFKITFRQEYILDPNSDRQCVNSVEPQAFPPGYAPGQIKICISPQAMPKALYCTIFALRGPQAFAPGYAPGQIKICIFPQAMPMALYCTIFALRGPQAFAPGYAPGQIKICIFPPAMPMALYCTIFALRGVLCKFLTAWRTLLTSAYLVEYTYLYSTYQCAYVDATYLCYAVNATLND